MALGGLGALAHAACYEGGFEKGGASARGRARLLFADPLAAPRGAADA